MPDQLGCFNPGNWLTSVTFNGPDSMVFIAHLVATMPIVTGTADIRVMKPEPCRNRQGPKGGNMAEAEPVWHPVYLYDFDTEFPNWLSDGWGIWNDDQIFPIARLLWRVSG